MINKFVWCAAILFVMGALICQADPPPNDDFANRIALSGNDTVFMGTLDGATTEKDPQGYGIEIWSNCMGYQLGTVWWSWTATQTSPVIIESLDSNCDGNECLTVWPPPNPQLGFPVITNFNVGGIQPVISLPL